MWLKMGCLDSSRGGRLWPTSFLLCGKMSAVRRALPKFRPTPTLSRAVGTGGRGRSPPCQLTLFQPGGRLYSPHYYTTRPLTSPRIFRDSYDPAHFAPDRASSRYFTNT